MSNSANRLLQITFCAIPIALFYWAVFAMSVNVPFQDDFDGLLEPVLQLHNQDISLSGFWQLIFTQDDERRIVVDRLLASAIYKTTGELNLRWMIIGGAFNLLLLLWVIGRWFAGTKTSWLLFLPIPWLLFNIQFYEAVFWAMIPFQHLAVFIWAVLTIWLISRNTTTALVGAILMAILTIFADVSGNFIIIPGLLILLAQHRWKEAGVWTLTIGVIVVLYFSGLEIPDYRPKTADNLRDPIRLISVFVSLFGTWSDPGPTVPFAIRSGLALILGFSGLCFVIALLAKEVRQLFENKMPLDKNQAFLWGSICFIAIILTVLATGRAAEGLESIFKPRYRHMYMFWIVFVYLLAIQYRPSWFHAKNVKLGVICGAVLFGINANMAYWGELDRYRKTFLADAYQWYNNRALPSSPIYLALRERVDEIYEGVYENGIYRPENYAFATLPDAPVKGEAEIEMAVLQGGLELTVKDIKRGAGKDDGAYVIFRAPSGEIQILPAHNAQRPMHRFILDRRYYYPDAQIERYVTGFFQSSEYTIEVGVIEGKNQYRLLTGKTLRL